MKLLTLGVWTVLLLNHLMLLLKGGSKSPFPVFFDRFLSHNHIILSFKIIVNVASAWEILNTSKCFPYSPWLTFLSVIIVWCGKNKKGFCPPENTKIILSPQPVPFVSVKV